MEFEAVVESRFSVRAYQSMPIARRKLERILEAARLAPTAANRQPVRVIVIHTEGREEELRRIYDKAWFVQPPLIIAVVGLRDEAWERTRSDGKSYLYVDGAIVMDHIILAATDQGLGTCWVGAFDPDAAREVLGLPENVEPIAFTPVGYADQRGGEKKRKDLEVLVKYERW